LADTDMGARVFYEMSAKLKRAGHGSGRGSLRSQFHKEMREVAKPLLPAVRRQAATRFASRGGLNRHMSKASRYRTVAKTGLTTAGVSIRANRTDPRADRQGRIAHPIPGPDGQPLRDEKGRRIMAVQRFPEAVGFFRETIEERADPLRAELIRRLERWFVDTFAGDF
jgi:hypothetical protein